MENYTWRFFLEDLLWIVPIVVGIICIAIGLYVKKKRSPIEVIFLCFLMAILSLGIGAFGTWRGAFLIYEALEVEYLHPEVIYEFWNYYWTPMIISGITSIVLFAIAVMAKLDWNKTNVDVAV